MGYSFAVPETIVRKVVMDLKEYGVAQRAMLGVSYRAIDEDFVEHDEWVEGFLARVIQHEFDHLDGKVFTDRISPLRRQMNKAKFNALLSGKVRCDYKVKAVKK